MPIKILMPALSPTMTEGNIAKWLKKEGDKISPGQVIAEIETDKATMEFESIDEGIIGKILIPEGTENIKVNTLIAIILEEGEDEKALESLIVSSSKTEPERPSCGIPKTFEEPEVKKFEETKEPSNMGRVFASPLAKRIASLENINLANIKGTGPHGRIIKADLLGLSTNREQKMLDRSTEEYRLIPNSNMRKIIAKRLTESKQTIPHFYLSVECIVDKMLEDRAEINKALGNEKDNKLSVNDFIILAVAKALKEVPEANSSFDESAVRCYNNIDIAVAVAIDNGLVTPIIRNADQKDIFSISKEMKDLVKKAKEGKLSPKEFEGGGITISNLGMYGIKNFQAIINPPQSCILAIGASIKCPVVINDQIQIATVMNVTLSCDHRAVDGAVSSRFLTSFKKFIEQPILMFVQ